MPSWRVIRCALPLSFITCFCVLTVEQFGLFLSIFIQAVVFEEPFFYCSFDSDTFCAPAAVLEPLDGL